MKTNVRNVRSQFSPRLSNSSKYALKRRVKVLRPATKECHNLLTYNYLKSFGTHSLLTVNFLRKNRNIHLMHKNSKPTFFKFVKWKFLSALPNINYSKLLLTHVTNEPTLTTWFSEHVSLVHRKPSLQNLHKALVTTKFYEFTPSLKTCITGTEGAGHYIPSQQLDFSLLRHNPDTSSCAPSFAAVTISKMVRHQAEYSPRRLLEGQLSNWGFKSPVIVLMGRSISMLKLQLGFRHSLKWINIQRRKSLKRYYTFYSHYVETVRDKRSYRRLMLPKFTDSRRGSFWTFTEQTLECTPNVTQQALNNVKSQTPRLLNNSPLIDDLTMKITTPKPLPVSSTSKTVGRSVLRHFQSNNRLTLKSYAKRFRKIRRMLKKPLRRFHRFHAYIRRRSKRYLRYLKRLTYRFTRLNTRREKKLSFKVQRKFLRRNYFKSLRRRIRRTLSRRFRFLDKRIVRPSYHDRASHTNLRRTVRTLYKLNLTLSRPAIHRLFVATDQTPYSLVTSAKVTPTQYSVSQRTHFTQTVNPNLDNMFMFKHQPLLTTLSPFKYLFSPRILTHTSKYYSFRNLILRIQQQIRAYSSSYTLCRLDKSNLWAINQSNYSIRRKFLRLIASSSFSADLSFWYYKTLIQFIENCSGRKTLLYFGPFIENSLTFEDRARCALWNNRVTGFQRIVGHRIFVYEALSIVAISIRLKDPTFLANWIRGMLKRLSFWRYRLIFRYLKFMLRYIFQPNFHLFDFRGVKLSLKGKISVAGNARTRTLFMRFGDTSHSKMDNKVAYDLSLVNTFTGVLGFKLLFYY